VHRRKTSNALDASVRCKQKRHGYRWPHGRRRSTLVAMWRSSLLAHLPGQRCSCQCVTQQTNVRFRVEWMPRLLMMETSQLKSDNSSITPGSRYAL